jgi:hypothetical protein
VLSAYANRTEVVISHGPLRENGQLMVIQLWIPETDIPEVLEILHRLLSSLYDLMAVCDLRGL